MKRLFAAITTIFILLSYTSVYAEGNIYYSLNVKGWGIISDGLVVNLNTYNDGNGVKFLAGKGEWMDVTIPYSIAGINITGLSKDFIKSNYFNKMYIPNNITYIEPFSASDLLINDGTVFCFEKNSYADSFFKGKTGFKTEYVNSIEKIDINIETDDSVYSNLESIERDIKLSNMKIDSIDVDLKAEYEKRIKNCKDGKYFIFDTDSDGIPELIVMDNDRKDAFCYYYGYHFDYENNNFYGPEVNGYGKAGLDTYEFYTINTNGKNRLIVKGTNKKVIDYSFMNKCYDATIIYDSLRSKNETERRYFIYESLYNNFLDGNSIISQASVLIDSEDLKSKADSFINQVEANPVKTYSVTDMTGLNSWDFSNIKTTAKTTENNTPAVSNNNNGISVLLNDSALSFTQPPVIENGTTLVPMRAIFEAMGASVDWNGETQTVTSVKDSTTISLTLNKNTATVNGKDISLAVPAKLINGSTMVPLRFVSESLGAEVNWDGASKTVTIKG